MTIALCLAGCASSRKSTTVEKIQTESASTDSASGLSWAFYSTLVKKIGNRYNGIYITRKIFFYAIVTMLPVLAFGDFRYDFSRLCQPSTYLNLIFLGVIASSLCFLIWSKIIWKIGPVAVNNFIYLMPLITMLASWLLLDEHLTPIAIAGGLVILAGVYALRVCHHWRELLE